MIRVVLDTNVVVSAIFSPYGFEARALELARLGAVEMAATKAILTEYEEVLMRPKFKFPKEVTISVMRRIRERAILCVPKVTLQVSPDESDNRFLECAEAAQAHYLVTGNLRHFPTRWKSTLVIPARRLVELAIDAARG